MADERYRRLLGIEPAAEVPTHYELLQIARDVTDEAVIEESYKSQMRKLQQIRTSKDKGFLEYLKEELRTARLTLTNAERRRVYDESLVADAIGSFKAFVAPLMALGLVPKGVFDTMVAKGVADGLTEERARQVVLALAAEHNAQVQTEDEPAPAPRAAEPAAVEEEESPYGDALGEEPSFSDEAPIEPPTAPSGGRPPSRFQETVLRAPSGAAPAAAPVVAREPERPRIRRGGFYDEAGPTTAAAAPASPWARGPAKPTTPWDRGGGTARTASSGPGETTQHQRERWRSEGERQQVAEARRLFNMGAKLAKIAGEVHDRLGAYFPPTNGKSTIVYQINGVGFEKVFDTEQKTFRDALKKFEAALQRLEGLTGPDVDEVRGRGAQNAGMIKGYLDEIKNHKLRQLAGLSKPDELRLWQQFVEGRRSARLTQTLDEG